MTRDDGRGLHAIVRAGAAVGMVGLLAAVALGPNLPGADAKALIPWRASDRSPGGSRVTVSPLVDIRTRLVDQAGIEVFQVKSPVRSYWRLTALETFDGRIWSSSRKYRRADGRLESGVPDDSLATDEVDQRFDIIALDSIWLPAAFRPISIDGAATARYDAESGSLLTDAATAIGAKYDVKSAVPKLDAAELQTATGEIPTDIAATYLTLPPAFPNDVTALAVGVVGDARTPYAAARQFDFFRGGQFTYDLDVPPGHGDDALQRFLFEPGRGYCEQFAGTYAAMARAVGLPARVGVGFTTGDLGPDGFFTVRGYHGHAWPEVYLAGFGWVAFEPTPGRGIPGGESYTGVPEQQASPGSPNSATTLATTSTTAAAGDLGASTTLPNIDLGDSGVQAGDTLHDHNPWPRRLGIFLVLAVLLPLLWAAGVTAVRVIRRWRRRAGAATPRDRVVVAWDEVGEALARSGFPSRSSETPAEYASHASRLAKIDPAVLDALAGLTTVSRYAPPDEQLIDEETAESALHSARAVERTLNKQLDRRTKLRTAIDPRIPAGR